MAGEWIKVETALPDKPEVLYIAGIVNQDADAVVGKLIRVWAWFDKHTRDGNALGVTFAFIDKLVGVTGFAEAMQFAGWLEQRGKVLSMPKFDNHNSESAKKRGLTQKRQQRFRNADVTLKTSPEKRREEKILNTKPPSADADPWLAGKEFLIQRGVAASTVGSFIGKLVSDHGKANVIEALQAAIVNEPADVKGYIVGALRGKKAKNDIVANNLAIARGLQ